MSQNVLITGAAGYMYVRQREYAVQKITNVQWWLHCGRYTVTR
jgi:hypothetical protein